MIDIRDIDKGIEWLFGLVLIVVPLSAIFSFVPWLRLITAIIISLLIIYLVYKSQGFKAFKIGIGIFFLIVLWSIYLNLIPY